MDGEVEYFSSRDRRDEVFGACREGNEWCCNGIVIVKIEDEAGKVFKKRLEVSRVLCKRLLF